MTTFTHPLTYLLLLSTYHRTCKYNIIAPFLTEQIVHRTIASYKADMNTYNFRYVNSQSQSEKRISVLAAQTSDNRTNEIKNLFNMYTEISIEDKRYTFVTSISKVLTSGKCARSKHKVIKSSQKLYFWMKCRNIKINYFFFTTFLNMFSTSGSMKSMSSWLIIVVRCDNGRKWTYPRARHDALHLFPEHCGNLLFVERWRTLSPIFLVGRERERSDWSCPVKQ